MSTDSRSRAARVAGPTAALLALCCAVTTGPAAVAADATGPSSSAAPYTEGTATGVDLTSILTAGDAVRGYPMAGTPDGLGAWDNGDGTFTVVMNHEFSTTEGTPRSHGNDNGSFVSRWTVDKDTLQVISGRDQIRDLELTSGGSNNLNRLCSADLADQGAYYDPTTGRGFHGRIFLNGEESGATGRAFGHVVSGGYNGISYELPALGQAAWENIAANPGTGDQTVTVGQSDGGTGNVYVYHGTKSATGAPMVRAGLAGGDTYSVSVDGMPSEDSTVPDDGSTRSFSLAAAGTGTAFDRPEDGAWDTQDPDVYYFATTASTTKHSRIWKMTFTNAAKPELGGHIEVLTEGPAVADSADEAASDGPLMMDNLTVSPQGGLLVQEDPGGSDYLSGVFKVDPDTGEFARVIQHQATYFAPGASDLVTTNEESSGIIPAPFLGKDTFLFSDQIHHAVADPAQVEMGQFLEATVPLPDYSTPPVTRQKVVVKLSGRSNGGRRDTLVAHARPLAAGATVELFRITRGEGRQLVRGRRLDRAGDARFLVRDLNGKRYTFYRALLERSDKVEKTYSNGLSIR